MVSSHRTHAPRRLNLQPPLRTNARPCKRSHSTVITACCVMRVISTQRCPPQYIGSGDDIQEYEDFGELDQLLYPQDAY
jgi:hypothetical protein